MRYPSHTRSSRADGSCRRDSGSAPRGFSARASFRQIAAALKSSCVLVLVLLSTACVTHLPGAALGPAHSVPCASDATAWIRRIEIADPTVERPQEIGDTLSLNVRSFLEQGHFFQSAKLLPGRPAPADLVLVFRLPRFYQVRDTHPAYFPLSILTLGLYPVFGGPVFIDESHLTGTLVVETATGETLATSTREASKRYTVSRYSPNFALPTGIDARTQLVQELIDDVCPQLVSR